MRHAMNVILTILCMLCILPASGRSDTLPECLHQAMEHLSVTQGTSSLCVLTNAGYVTVDGQSTVAAIDTIQDITGCTSGSGRLLFFHRSSSNPLRIVLFDKTAYRCVVISQTTGEASLGDMVDIGLSHLGNEQEWSDIQAVLGSDASTIVTFAHQWAAGAPYDFMKCAEFHNHICPGVTSGYFLVKYIQKNLLPETEASCSFIACPVWCKDDAIQILLDMTVGKKSLTAKNLTDEQLSSLKDDTVAGILLVSKSGEERTTAYILGFDWDAADKLSGSGRDTGMAARIINVTGLIPYYDKPEALVKVLDTRQVTSDEVTRMTSAGVNPYEVLHFTN